MGIFIMPGLVNGTRLHGGKDMHQPGMFAALFDDFGNHVFFSDMRFVDVLDSHTMRIGKLMRAPANAFAPRVGKDLGVVDT